MTTPIRMNISNRVCLVAVDGDLQAWSDAGAVMHMAIVHGEIHGRSLRTPHLRAVRAPVPAWAAFQAWCWANGSSIPGAGRAAEQAAVAMTRAAARIGSEFEKLAKHPAYRGIAIVGTSAVVLPAYRYGDVGRWWPSPQMAQARWDGEDRLQTANLVPSTVTMAGRIFTRWVLADT